MYQVISNVAGIIVLIGFPVLVALLCMSRRGGRA
jgi:hypothetical protein